ncbi:polysaccharide deacetylase family protein [Clostridium paraputrificum]|uniref:polysaccharide deacetylase family protein n=1 Tax=Clostridium TaxID=1485 RepID=UPI003D33BFE5
MPKNSKNKLSNYIIIGLIIVLIAVVAVIFVKEQSSNKADNKAPQEEIANNNEITNEESIEKEKDRFEGLTLVNDNRGVPVLYYHSVEPSEANEVIISPDKLREQLLFIKNSGYTTLTMAELNDYILNDKAIPEKSIVVTFDDGYMDNYTNAFPILKELDMKATVFVITNGIDDGYYMSSAQLKEMSDYGLDIESHTYNHLHLNQLTYEKQLEELKTSKEKLEAITGKTVISVAYPFGDLNEDSKKAVKEAGYSLAFTTDLGYADKDDDPITLDRIYVSSTYTMDQFKNRLINIQK